MKKLLNLFAVGSCVLMISVLVFADDKDVVDQVKIQIKSEIGKEIENLPTEIRNKIEEAKKITEEAKTENYNSVVVYTEDEFAKENFLKDVNMMEGVSAEVKAQIEASWDEISERLKEKVNEIEK